MQFKCKLHKHIFCQNVLSAIFLLFNPSHHLSLYILYIQFIRPRHLSPRRAGPYTTPHGQNRSKIAIQLVLKLLIDWC